MASMWRVQRASALLLTLTLAIGVAGCGDGDGGGGGASPGGDGDGGGGGASPGGDGAAGEFDWKAFDGEEIRVVLNQHPWQVAIEPLIPEFEELTGITVETESLPEAQFRQRVQVEMTGSSEDLDVFMTSVQNEGANFASNGWYADLRQFADDPSLLSADYDFDDISESILEGHTFQDVLAGMPIQLETQMLFYRRDIFEAAGVEVPQTLEELEQVAQEIDDPGGVRAFVARGRAAAAVTQISTYLFNHGANWTEPGSEDDAATFDTPEGVEAFDFYGRMVREYGPPGAVNMSWEEALPLFQQGQVAMYTDASTFLPRITDPTTSQVVETAGFAKMPSGPGGEFQTFNGWALAISPFSQKQEAAWYFVQWATSPETVERLTEEGIAGARQSVEFGEAYPEDWVQAFTESLPDARAQLPQVIPVPEVRDAIGTAIVAAIEGEPVEPAVQAAAEEFNQIVGAPGG